MTAERLIDVSNEVLLARTADEPEAFGLFYDRFERRVLAFLSRATGRSDVAADLTAEVFAELRAALVAAADRQRQLATSAPVATASSSRRFWWPLQLRTAVIAVAALLAIAAVALAAAGVFSPGRTVAPVAVPKPRAFDGAAIPSTIRLLSGAADPAGGPTWGLRLVDTTRGEVCIEPGRVQNGVIGVLGRDRAFGDDGRLHPFAADYIGPIGCAVPEARGHAFLNIGQIGLPASALIQGAQPRLVVAG